LVGWSLPFLVSTNTDISETRTESEALLHFYELLPLIADLKNITHAQTIRAHYV